MARRPNRATRATRWTWVLLLVSFVVLPVLVVQTVIGGSFETAISLVAAVGALCLLAAVAMPTGSEVRRERPPGATAPDRHVPRPPRPSPLVAHRGVPRHGESGHPAG